MLYSSSCIDVWHYYVILTLFIVTISFFCLSFTHNDKDDMLLNPRPRQYNCTTEKYKDDVPPIWLIVELLCHYPRYKIPSMYNVMMGVLQVQWDLFAV